MASLEQPPTEDALLAEHAALDREEAETFSLRLALPGWLRENPGLSLTLIYLFASVVGIVFHYHLLRRFGFNVLEFSETTDFLMVVVREPLTVALALLGVPFYMLYMAVTFRVSRWGRQRSAWLRSSPEKRRQGYARMRPWAPWMQLLFIVVYANVFVLYYSRWRANQIRAGDFRPVEVHYKTDSPTAGGAFKAEKLAVVTTMSRYVVFYDPAARKSEVVPLDSIARLVWDARTRKERAAEAAK